MAEYHKKNIDGGKMKLLVYCDSPEGSTGYSRQAKNILSRLHQQGFEIAVIGINHMDNSPNEPFGGTEFPFKIFRANIQNDPRDQEGRGLLQAIFAKLSPDIFLTIGDIWSFRGWFREWLERMQFRYNFKTIGYYSTEYTLNDEDVDILRITDYPITHSKWGLGFSNGSGYDEIKKIVPNLIYIPDTVDSQTFYPQTEDQRQMDRQSVGIKSDYFVIANVNRNTVRKDLIATIKAFKRVKKEIPNARLYLHTAAIDEWTQGETIDLLKRCKIENLTVGNNFDFDVSFPLNFTPHYGWPDNLLNRIYNCSDLIISTAVSEGFGVTPVEALFCQRPVLIPGHTGFSNICETTGITPVRSYPTKDERVSTDNIYKIDEDDLVNKIIEAYDNRNKPQYRTQSLGHSLKAIESFDADRVFKNYWMPVISDITQVKGKKKAVLFVQRGSAGDVLITSSCFPGLRQRHPNTPLIYMTKPQYKNIVEGLVDDVIDWQPSLIHEYENVYMPHEFRVLPGNWGSGDSTLTRIYSEILGVPFNRPQIIPDPVDNLPPEYIVVHTTSHGFRTYLNFHVALDKCKLPIIQIGTRSDYILGNGDFEFIDMRGKLSYRQTAYIISKSKLFVGIDSYPMHVAGVFDVPMVVTFGSGAARVTAALSNGAQRFLEPVYSKVCPIVGACFGNYDCKHPCGERHSPEIVREAIKQIMPDLFKEAIKDVSNVTAKLKELLNQKSRKEASCPASV